MFFRKRFSFVLVSMFLWTSFSVPTMGRGSNSIDNWVTVTTNSVIGDWNVTTSGALEIIDVPILTIQSDFGLFQDDTFYISLNNALFADKDIIEQIKLENFILEKSDNDIAITYIGTEKFTSEIKIPIIATALEGHPSITIQGEGVSIQSGRYSIGNNVDTDLYIRLPNGTIQLAEGEYVLPVLQIEEEYPGSFYGNEILDLELSSDEWEILDGQVQVTSNSINMEGVIEDNKLMLTVPQYYWIDTEGIYIEGVRVKSVIEPVTNGWLEMSISHPEVSVGSNFVIGEIASNSSEITIRPNETRIYEKDGQTQHTRVIISSERISVPEIMKLKIEGGNIYSYTILGDFESNQISDSEIIITKIGDTKTFPTLELQIQGTKVGKINAILTSDEIEDDVCTNLGDVISSSSNTHINQTTTNKVIREEIDIEELEDLIRNQIEEVLNTSIIDTEKREYIGFDDVQANDWYYEMIREAYELGIVSGYQDNTFKPDQTITRAETLSMIMNLYEVLKQ